MYVINGSYEYGSSTGDRIILYLPDGGDFKYNKKCFGMHDDHIFPLSLGGSNNEINHQLLSSSENLSKSNSIEFIDIKDINPNMLSSKCRDVLQSSNTIQELKISLTRLVYEDISQRNKLEDNELLAVYVDYFKFYNLNKNPFRAVKKFREFCKNRNIV